MLFAFYVYDFQKFVKFFLPLFKFSKFALQDFFFY